MRKSTKERFEEKTMPVPESGCWIWMGASNSAGYGVFYLNGRMTTANRASYEIYRGRIPQNHFACHICDIPLCVNPNHLFTGTQQDNLRDMVRKGRHNGPRGEAHHLSKLTEKQVLAIREDTRKLREIAADYGVAHQIVSYIKRRETWAWLPEAS